MKILSTLQIREARTLGAERAAALLAKVPDVEHTAPVVAALEAVAGYTSAIELAHEALADARRAASEASKSVRTALAANKGGKLAAWADVSRARDLKVQAKERIEALEAGLVEATAALCAARTQATQAAMQAIVALRPSVDSELLQARAAAVAAEETATRIESRIRLLASRHDHLEEEGERLGKAAAAFGGGG